MSVTIALEDAAVVLRAASRVEAPETHAMLAREALRIFARAWKADGAVIAEALRRLADDIEGFSEPHI